MLAFCFDRTVQRQERQRRGGNGGFTYSELNAQSKDFFPGFNMIFYDFLKPVFVSGTAYGCMCFSVLCILVPFLSFSSAPGVLQLIAELGPPGLARQCTTVCTGVGEVQNF